MTERAALSKFRILSRKLKSILKESGGFIGCFFSRDGTTYLRSTSSERRMHRRSRHFITLNETIPPTEHFRTLLYTFSVFCSWRAKRTMPAKELLRRISSSSFDEWIRFSFHVRFDVKSCHKQNFPSCKFRFSISLSCNNVVYNITISTTTEGNN